MNFVCIKDTDGEPIIFFFKIGTDIKDAIACCIEQRLDLSKAYFYSEDLSGVNFTGVDLSNAVFKDCKLHATNFKDAKTDNISFSGCDSENAKAFYFFSQKSFACADGDVVTYGKVEGIDGSKKTTVSGQCDEFSSKSKEENIFSFGCN